MELNSTEQAQPGGHFAPDNGQLGQPLAAQGHPGPEPIAPIAYAPTQGAAMDPNALNQDAGAI